MRPATTLQEDFEMAVAKVKKAGDDKNMSIKKVSARRPCTAMCMCVCVARVCCYPLPFRAQ